MASSFTVHRWIKSANRVPQPDFGQAPCCRADSGRGSLGNLVGGLFHRTGTLFCQYHGAGISEQEPGQCFRGTDCCDGSLPGCAGRSQHSLLRCHGPYARLAHRYKVDILERMADILNPGGYLFLAASEAMTRYSDAVDRVRCNSGVVYKKK